jgi:signal peptidase I
MNLDFATLMAAGVAVTGVVWAADAWVLGPRRRALAGDDAAKAREPTLVEYCRTFFPVILAVFVLRSFVAEPFRIPSGSMLPTLRVGDFILVNKFAYGLRLPLAHVKVLDLGAPRRGDVVVFRYPPDPSVDYIKRVVGVPGDRIGYFDKVLYVNGQAVTRTGTAVMQEGPGPRRVLLDEVLDGRRHHVQWYVGHPTVEGEVTVPAGAYFVMGDNRDNSKDSRFWGFVPDGNLVGKAFLIWMSWDAERMRVSAERIGDLIR